MDQPTQDNDDRLEQMLRRWGADEASQRARPTEAPTEALQTLMTQSPDAAPRPAASAATSAPTPPRRWAPLLAAAAVLIAALGILAGTFLTPSLRIVRMEAGAPDTRPADGDAELAALREELRQRTDELQQAETQLAAEQAARQKDRAELDKIATLRVQNDRLQQDANALQADNIKLAAEAKLAGDALRDIEGRMKQTDDEIASLRKQAGQVDELKAEVRRLAGLETKLVAATAEIRNIQKLHEAALAEVRRARTDFAAYRDSQAGRRVAFRNAYLAASAPGEDGLPALRTAVANTRMLERCAELRLAARRQSDRRLLDQLEVVLTRLTMLDLANFDAKNTFVALVRNSKLTQQVEQALEADGVPPVLHGWLLEANIILTGVESVG